MLRCMEGNKYESKSEIDINLQKQIFFSSEKCLDYTPLKNYGLFLLLILSETSNQISSRFWHK